MTISKPKRNGRRAELATSPTLSDASVTQNLNVADLMEPVHAARLSFDEEKLFELIDSIKAVGVLTPLLVEPEGRKYRVHAGHRRLVAVRAIGLEQVPCRVFPPGACSGEALKHHENKFREDLNAAEEARHFALLLESQCGGDTDKLCALVQERRDYVEQRLNLIGGDHKVFQALADSAISIGVAQELNRVNEPATRMMFLDSAMQNGATVRMVRDWRMRANVQDAIAAGGDGAPAPGALEKQTDVNMAFMRCYICQRSDDTHEMEILYVHRSCAKAVERMNAAAGQDAAAEEEQR